MTSAYSHFGFTNNYFTPLILILRAKRDHIFKWGRSPLIPLTTALGQTATITVGLLFLFVFV